MRYFKNQYNQKTDLVIQNPFFIKSDSLIWLICSFDLFDFDLLKSSMHYKNELYFIQSILYFSDIKRGLCVVHTEFKRSFFLYFRKFLFCL